MGTVAKQNMRALSEGINVKMAMINAARHAPYVCGLCGAQATNLQLLFQPNPPSNYDKRPNPGEGMNGGTVPTPSPHPFATIS